MLISHILNCEREVKHFNSATLTPYMAVEREQQSCLAGSYH